MNREQVIARLVKALRDFGYPDCSSENILTDPLYRQFALRELKEVAEQLEEAGRLVPSAIYNLVTDLGGSLDKNG